MYQGSEYTRILNILKFWICLWFSIYQSSEYARLTHGPECIWIISEYAGICVNVPKSARIAFALHIPIVIPCLFKRVVTHFNKVSSLREHEVLISIKCQVWGNMRFFSWRDKIWFLYSSWKYFICFLCQTKYFYKQDLQFGTRVVKGRDSCHTII